jgi:hypothetical protein
MAPSAMSPGHRDFVNLGLIRHNRADDCTHDTGGFFLNQSDKKRVSRTLNQSRWCRVPTIDKRLPQDLAYRCSVS